MLSVFMKVVSQTVVLTLKDQMSSPYITLKTTFLESIDWRQFIVNSVKNSNGYTRMKR